MGGGALCLNGVMLMFCPTKTDAQACDKYATWAKYSPPVSHIYMNEILSDWPVLGQI